MTIHLEIPRDKAGQQIPGLIVYTIELQYNKEFGKKVIEMAVLQKLVSELLKSEINKIDKNKPKSGGEEGEGGGNEKQPEKEKPETPKPPTPLPKPDTKPDEGEEEELPLAARVRLPHVAPPSPQAVQTGATLTMGAMMIYAIMILGIPVGI